MASGISANVSAAAGAPPLAGQGEGPNPGANAAALPGAGMFLALLGSLIETVGGETATRGGTESGSPANSPAHRDSRAREKKDQQKAPATALSCSVQVALPTPTPLPLTLAVSEADAARAAKSTPPGKALSPPAAPQGQVDAPVQPAGKLAFAARLLDEDGPKQQPPQTKDASLASIPPQDRAGFDHSAESAGNAASEAKKTADAGRLGDRSENSNAAPQTEAAGQDRSPNSEVASEAQPSVAKKPSPEAAQRGDTGSSAGEVAQTQPSAVAPAELAWQSQPARSLGEIAPAPSAPAGSALPADQAPVPAPSAPAREISVIIPGTDRQGVEVRVVEQAGALRVAVRTPDVNLADNLRQDLNQLVSRLEEKGYRAETWRPAEIGGGSLQNRGEERGDSGYSPRRFQGEGQSQGGQGRRGSGQQRGNRPRWLEELEHQQER
jgi:hypothetical protein